MSPYSTFLVRSNSNYPEAGIIQGSILAIDRVLTPQQRYITATEANGALMLRSLLINSVPALQELREDETITQLDKDQGLPV